RTYFLRPPPVRSSPHHLMVPRRSSSPAPWSSSFRLTSALTRRPSGTLVPEAPAAPDKHREPRSFSRSTPCCAQIRLKGGRRAAARASDPHQSQGEAAG